MDVEDLGADAPKEMSSEEREELVSRIAGKARDHVIGGGRGGSHTPRQRTRPALTSTLVFPLEAVIRLSGR